jgi:hypothetical protein
MKKLIFLLALFAVCKSASAQTILSTQDTRYNFFEFSIGAGVPFINNKDFDNWTETNYHNRQYNNVEETVNFYYVGKNIDIGVQGTTSSEIYQTVSIYLGRRVTSVNSPITSFINLGFGGFVDDIYDYAPVGYLRTEDQVGQRLYMQYTALFITLQSRNYINNLGFNISRNRRLNVKSGFYVNFNYRPLGTNWQYGYDKKTQQTEYDDDGNPYTQTDTKYTSNFAPGVPALASRFIDAGVFVAITLSTTKKHGYYSK